MKPSLRLITSLLLLSVGFIFAQKSIKVPADAVFYMEVNGKQLDQKINWDEINPFLAELGKKEKKKLNWNDFTKTGINYNATQYHYAIHNDSITSYVAHLPIENTAKFLEFINAAKEDGKEIIKKNNYSYVDVENETFIAWNDHQAVLKYIDYRKPVKLEDIELEEIPAVVVDSAAVAVASSSEAAAEAAEAEKPFNYKEEIEYLKDEIKYLKESIKDNQKEIAEMQKNIKYLEKHHKYPADKDPYKEDAKQEEEDEGVTDATVVSPPIASEPEEYDIDSDYQKEMDSIRIENFKISKRFSEEAFDQIFNSNYKIETDARFTSFKDANADVYVFTNFGKLSNDIGYSPYSQLSQLQSILNKANNADSFYNLYFDKDKVRMVNNYQHRDPEMHKTISDIYNGKRNRKLAALVNDKRIGSIAINIRSDKYFDLMYDVLKSAGDEKEQKEIALFIETMKIALDEKAIAKLAPGNGIFILNEFKKKTVEYTDYNYDEDYNTDEEVKTKEVNAPDFTFAFATENEGYWNRVFNAIVSNNKFGNGFEKIGDIYSFKQERQSEVDKMFFTVRDNIVYFTTSLDNLSKEKNNTNRKLARESSKHAMYGKIDLQRLLKGFDEEFKSLQDKNSFDYFKNNVGEIIYKTDNKSNSVETELIYQLKNAKSENSLMYFFDLFKEFYKDDYKKVDNAY